MAQDLIRIQNVHLPDGSMSKNVIIFGVNMTSSLHIDNKKKYILILCKGLTQGLDLLR